LVLLIQALALLLRVLAGLFKQAGTALCMLYDAVIFLPLIIEKWVRGRPAAVTHGRPVLVERMGDAEQTATGGKG